MKLGRGAQQVRDKGSKNMKCQRNGFQHKISVLTLERKTYVRTATTKVLILFFVR